MWCESPSILWILMKKEPSKARFLHARIQSPKVTGVLYLDLSRSICLSTNIKGSRCITTRANSARILISRSIYKLKNWVTSENWTPQSPPQLNCLANYSNSKTTKRFNESPMLKVESSNPLPTDPARPPPRQKRKRERERLNCSHGYT